MRVQFDGKFIADFETEELYRNGRVRRIERKPFRFLGLLLSRPRRLIRYPEIMAFLWPDVKIDTRNNVKEVAQKLRQALGSDARQLECLRGRGYRLMVDISEAPDTGLTPPPAVPGVPGQVLTTAGAESISHPAL